MDINKKGMRVVKIINTLFNKLLNTRKTAAVIHPDYKNYEYAQKVTFKSHEIDVPKWEEGQMRFIERWFKDYDKGLSIADISCGDGVGLRQFRKLGFLNVTGVDFEEEKIIAASKTNYKTYLADFHDLSIFQDNTFDIVYSSHSLEHSYNPRAVLNEFKRILKVEGQLILVLPYPDSDDWNIKAHCAKYELGTNKNDNAKAVTRYVESFGFKLLKKELDQFREPEVWLCFTKIP